MHISEGVLTPTVLAAGAALAAGGVGLGLRKLDDDRIPVVAVLASAFFVASLIHVPVGAGSAHLILNGLAGVVLGWAAFPALLVGLLLHAILFGYGGLTVLGVNTFIMAAPGVVCHYVCRRRLIGRSPRRVFAMGFGVGAASVAMAAALFGAAMVAGGREFIASAAWVAVAHLPVMAAEGLITGSVLVFLVRVRPEIFAEPIAPEEVEHD